jgi:hypothetical protein
LNQRYTVRLVARNEGIEYRDEGGLYRFNVALKQKRWTAFLPGSKGDFFQTHVLTPEEYDRIGPRIIKYLESKKYFGFIGPSYPALFAREAPVSEEIAQSRLQAAAYWEEKRRADESPSKNSVRSPPPLTVLSFRRKLWLYRSDPQKEAP